MVSNLRNRGVKPPGILIWCCLPPHGKFEWQEKGMKDEEELGAGGIYPGFDAFRVKS